MASRSLPFGRALPALLVVAHVCSATLARADEPSFAPSPPSPPSPASPTTRAHGDWYGGQTLALDAAVLGLAGGGVGVLASDTPKGVQLGLGLPMLMTGLMGYALASPILHWVHGHPVDPRSDPTMKNAAYARVAGLFLGLGVALFGGIAVAGGIGDRPPSQAPNPAATVFPISSIALGLTIPIVLDLALWTFEPKPQN